MSIKTLLADDHAIVVEGLREILSHDDEIEVVGSAANGEEVMTFVRLNDVDVVVLDINMPIMDGITCAKHLKKDHKDVKVLILTMYPQKSFVTEIVNLGIDGCLLKNNTGQELGSAIHRVASGRQYYDRIRTFNSEEQKVIQYKLSKREIEVVKCVAEGLTSTEIAERLFISEHTVNTHRKNILKKLGLKNSSELVNFANENQLI